MTNQQKKNQLAELDKLYETLPDNLKETFMKKYGLIHIRSLDIEDYCEDKEEKKNWDYIFTLSDEELNYYFRQIEKELQHGKALVLKMDNNGKLEDRYYGTRCVYNVIASVCYEDFLILARNEDVIRNFKQYMQKIQKGFCDGDTYDLDSTLTKELLPKLFKHFEENTNSYPPDITNEHWHKILKEIIWGLEIFRDDFNYKMPDAKSEEYKKFVKRYNRAFRLLGKYFTHLWD